MTRVTLLTQASCAFCDQAKNVLARLGTDYRLDITEVSLDTDDGRGLGLRHGILFAPGILLDGELFSYGRLSERKLRRELNRHHATSRPPQVT